MIAMRPKLYQRSLFRSRGYQITHLILEEVGEKMFTATMIVLLLSNVEVAEIETATVIRLTVDARDSISTILKDMATQNIRPDGVNI